MSAPLNVGTLPFCPINFTVFQKFNAQTGNSEASLLLTRLAFHFRHSTLMRFGKKQMARSREQMARWFGWSLRKVDHLLHELAEKGLIEKRASLWASKKQLFIHVHETTLCFSKLPINLELLDFLTKKTGTIQTALLLGRIAFALNQTKIEHEGMRWCTIKRKTLADFLAVSVRTVDEQLKRLEERGYIIKRCFTYRERSQLHYTLPNTTLEQLKKELETYKLDKQREKKEKSVLPLSEKMDYPNPLTEHSEQADNTEQEEKTMLICSDNIKYSLFCRSRPANFATSIIEKSTKEKENKNNSNNHFAKNKKAEVSTITFNNFKDSHSSNPKQDETRFNLIGKWLSKKQTNYLQGAFKKVLEWVNVSNQKELWEQLVFSITNSQQRKKIEGFKHAVNHFLKIIKDNRWKTPYGFYNHCPAGQKQKAAVIEREKAHESFKKQAALSETHEGLWSLQAILGSSGFIRKPFILTEMGERALEKARHMMYFSLGLEENFDQKMQALFQASKYDYCALLKQCSQDEAKMIHTYIERVQADKKIMDLKTFKASYQPT